MNNRQAVYRCTGCGNTADRAEDGAAPSCCGRAMVKDPLPYCTSADHAEMARTDDSGDACDDGRAYSG